MPYLNFLLIHFLGRAKIINMENIYTAAKPLYNLMKVLGLFPMTIEGFPSKVHFKTKYLDVLASIISCLIPVILICLNSLFTDAPTSSSLLLSQFWVVQASFGSLLILIQFFLQISKRHSITSFLKEIDDFDQKVRNL